MPTARFRICDSADAALSAIARGEFGYPLVIKADGLAAGKGVVIAEDRAARRGDDSRRRWSIGDSARRASASCSRNFSSGQEASYFVLADGTGVHAAVVGAGSQAHLRRRPRAEHGRHGCVCAESADRRPRSSAQVIETIVGPVLDGMAHEGHPYRGFLYVGLMLTADGPKVIEFNVRFGDPEAQVILPMLDEDLSLAAGCRGNRRVADHVRHGSADEPHVGVVLAAGGYPGHGRNREGRFTGLEAAAACRARWCFTRGRRVRDGRIVTAGRPRAHGRRPRRDYRDAIDIAYTRGVADHVRRHAVSARHRAESVQWAGLTAIRMKYSIVTFGCRVNQADSLAIEEQLRAAEHRRVAPEDADLVVVNTCSVTATADQGARQTIQADRPQTTPTSRSW